MKILKIVLPFCLFAVLFLSVGIQVAAYINETPVVENTNPPLEKAIPESLPGWETTELDLGPTESVTEASERILNLDDFVHRRYSSPRGSFSVYVAYWGPGKMPIRLVSQHTPDRCWTENGWTCTDRRFNVQKFVGGEELQPAQWGEYAIQEFENESYFWHVVNGEAKWFAGESMNTRTTVGSFVTDLRNFTFNKKPDQYFVRIVSQQSLDELWQLPGFQRVMADLADLCLAYPENEKAPDPEGQTL